MELERAKAQTQKPAPHNIKPFKKPGPIFLQARWGFIHLIWKKTTFYEEFFLNSKPKSPKYSGSSLTRVRGSKPDEARGPKIFLPRFCSLNFSKLWLFGFSNSIYWVFFGVSVTSPCSVFCLLGKNLSSESFLFGQNASKANKGS